MNLLLKMFLLCGLAARTFIAPLMCKRVPNTAHNYSVWNQTIKMFFFDDQLNNAIIFTHTFHFLFHPTTLPPTHLFLSLFHSLICAINHHLLQKHVLLFPARERCCGWSPWRSCSLIPNGQHQASPDATAHWLHDRYLT